MSLDQEQLNEIIALLTPIMEGKPDDRLATLKLAFGLESPLVAKLDYSGDTATFLLLLIAKLEQHGESEPGKPALWVLLNTIRDQVGVDRKQRIDALRSAFNLPPEPLPDRCFVSYSRQESEFALRLVSDLTDAGLRVWFDREKLKGGDEWWRSIEQGMKNADFVVFCLSPESARSPIANREVQLARDLSKPIIPAMFIPCLELLQTSEHQNIAWLSDLHVLDFTQPEQYGEAFHDLLRSLPGYKPPDTYFDVDPTQIPNPFRGLEAFRLLHHHYFSGREDDVAKLLERLRFGGEQLLAVVGASGSGKSSIVYAGLVPALWQQQDKLSLWETTTLTPGKTPLGTLVEWLALRTGLSSLLVRQALAQPDGLNTIVNDLLRGKPDGTRLLLIIDQFEEVFTLANEGECAAFIDALHHAATVAGGRTYILLTLRADFFDRLGKYPALARLVEANLYIVAEMKADALRRSIEQPARKVGLVYEEGLVDALLEEIRNQPGSLPLLQYALKELYERRLGRKLTYKAYEAIGKVKGALATRAEAIHEELTVEHRSLMRRILLKLVAVGESEVTRRRVERAELVLEGVNENEIQNILDRLTAWKARLLVVTSPIGDADKSNDRLQYYEISHEALIGGWKRFAGWVERDRVGLRLDSEYRRRAEAWDKDDRKAEHLLRGHLLETAQAWLQEVDTPTPLQQEFIKASANAETERMVLEEQRIRKLKDAEASADQAKQEATQATKQAQQAEHEAAEKAKRAEILRKRAWVATLAAVLFIFGALVAFAVALVQTGLLQQESTRANTAADQAQAERERANTAVVGADTRVAQAGQTLTPIPPMLTGVAHQIAIGEARLADTESQRLAAIADAMLVQGRNAETATLLSIRGVRKTYTEQADRTLMRSLENVYTLNVLKRNVSPITSVAYSSDGSTILTGGEDNRV